MPASINGTTMPPNPRAKEYRIRIFSGNLVSGSMQDMFRHPSASNAGALFNQIEEQFTEYFLVVKICSRRFGLNQSAQCKFASR
jgi:hypothetical protein